MMKLLRPLAVFIVILLSYTSFEGCSSSSDDPAPPVPPNTQLNDLFDNVYLGSSGFQDAAKTTPTAEGKGVFVIKDLMGDKDLIWGNARKIPSPMWPELPFYVNDEFGGYIFIPNISDSFWASEPFATMPQPFDIYVVLRDVEAVSFEGYFAGPYGLRNRGDQLELSTTLGGTTKSVEMDKPTILEFNKRTIVRMRVDGGNSSLWLNNKQVTPNTVDLGTNGIDVLNYGTNSHIAQHDFYGLWVNFGTLTDEEHKFIYEELEKQYKPGEFPDEPFANNIRIDGNAAGSPREWTASYEYVSTSGSSEDTGKVEYQWGYYRIDNDQDLNTADLFTGPNSKNKVLKRADFPTEFPKPGENKTFIFVIVKVYDVDGKFWDHLVRSALTGDNY